MTPKYSRFQIEDEVQNLIDYLKTFRNLKRAWELNDVRRTYKHLLDVAAILEDVVAHGEEE